MVVLEIYDDIDRLPHEQFRLVYETIGTDIALTAFTHRSCIDMYIKHYTGLLGKCMLPFGQYPKPPKHY